MTEKKKPEELSPEKLKNIVDGIFEIHDLPRVERSGWKKIGVKDPENVAEHNGLTAQIAYILAILEDSPNPEKAACMALFHDNAEARVGDPNRISAGYLKKFGGKSFKSILEGAAFMDFSKQFPEEVQKRLNSLFLEFENVKTQKAIIAKDADYLQLIFQAKIYLDIGYQTAKAFIDNTGKRLKTKSAKAIFEIVKKTDFTDWLDEDYEYNKEKH